MIRRITSLLPYPMCAGLYALANAFPGITESRYSLGAYQSIRRWLQWAFGGWPFSAAEIAVYVIALAVISRIASGLASALRGRVRGLVNAAWDIVAGVGVACLLFVAMWGINNCRLPFSEAAGLDVRPAPTGELEAACKKLMARSGELRVAAAGSMGERGAAEPGMGERGAAAGSLGGALPLEGGKSSALSRAPEGFAALASRFPSLGLGEEAGRGGQGSPPPSGGAGLAVGTPKPVFASKLMSYCGITGVYFPMTGEANVNMDIQDAEAPFTMCHELAHQLGYAREDEANFIAWLACDASPYADFRYSGNLMAFLHLMDRLYEADPGRHAAVLAACPPEVASDLAEMGAYWQLHEGVVSDASARVNDAFLKINGQQEGVASYGRMADLMLAYLRAPPGQ